jgi:hypothetical protein
VEALLHDGGEWGFRGGRVSDSGETRNACRTRRLGGGLLSRLCSISRSLIFLRVVFRQEIAH